MHPKRLFLILAIVIITLSYMHVGSKAAESEAIVSGNQLSGTSQISDENTWCEIWIEDLRLYTDVYASNRTGEFTWGKIEEVNDLNYGGRVFYNLSNYDLFAPTHFQFLSDDSEVGVAHSGALIKVDFDPIDMEQETIHGVITYTGSADIGGFSINELLGIDGYHTGIITDMKMKIRPGRTGEFNMAYDAKSTGVNITPGYPPRSYPGNINCNLSPDGSERTCSGNISTTMAFPDLYFNWDLYDIPFSNFTIAGLWNGHPYVIDGASQKGDGTFDFEVPCAIPPNTSPSAISAVEFTQGTQQTLKSLNDLLAEIAVYDRASISIIEQKPLTMRLYMNEVDTVTQYRVQLSGFTTEEKQIQLQPHCTIEQQRQQENGCQSVDFNFTPPDGEWTEIITIFDENNNELEQRIFTLYSMFIPDPDPNPNTRPSVDAGGPYSVDEGGRVTLTATGDDPDGDPLEYVWDLNNDGKFEAPGRSVEFSAASIDGPGRRDVNVKVTDPGGLSALAKAQVIVNNVAPSVGEISVVNLVSVNNEIRPKASFTDPGVFDRHTAIWNWGDGTSSPGQVNKTTGSDSGTVLGSHTYTTPGVYSVQLKVIDDEGDVGAKLYQYVVVYDRDGGSVSGDGTIESPRGAYFSNFSLTGPAQFNIDAKYTGKSPVPTGDTSFDFNNRNVHLSFSAVSYEWLVVDGSKAQFKGEGTINGKGTNFGDNYKFILTAVDGDISGGGNADKFRIKIWSEDPNGNETVVYDNQPNAGINAPLTTNINEGDDIKIMMKIKNKQ